MDGPAHSASLEQLDWGVYCILYNAIPNYTILYYTIRRYKYTPTVILYYAILYKVIH